ncbi:MAG: hypothetical protein R3A47_09615 [Polyangiales bacterium]
MKLIASTLFAALLAGLFSTASGCKKPVNPNYETPLATMQSLFRAYGIEKMTELEIQQRIAAQQRFSVEDEALFMDAFEDVQSDADQGLTGYIFGRSAPVKDSLVVRVQDDTAFVTVKGHDELEPIVLLKANDEWKISLKRSVPEEIRLRLYDVYRRAKDREDRAVKEATAARKQSDSAN